MSTQRGGRQFTPVKSLATPKPTQVVPEIKRETVVPGIPVPDRKELLFLIFELILFADEPGVRAIINYHADAVKEQYPKMVSSNIDELVEEGFFPPFKNSMTGGAKNVPLKLKSESTPKKTFPGYKSIALTHTTMSRLKELDVCRFDAASQIFRVLFPSLYGEYRARKTWEHCSSSKQCEAVIGEKGKEFCYICGFKYREDVAELTMRCEHILPIAQAVIFLKLYNPKTDLNPKAMYELQLEYAYAHDCCNKIKSSNSFLMTQKDEDNNVSFVRNNEYIQTLLKSIIDESSECAGIVSIQIPAEKTDEWISERAASISVRVDKIVDYIASKGSGIAVLTAGFRKCADKENLSRRFLYMINNYKDSKDDIFKGKDESIMKKFRHSLEQYSEIQKELMKEVKILHEMITIYAGQQTTTGGSRKRTRRNNKNIL